MTLDEWKQSGDHYDHEGLPVFFHRDGAGELLLCLHGFPTSSYDFHKIWAGLTGRFDVIAFDMVGYGLSAKPTDWGYTTFDQVDVLEALLRTSKVTRINILAHDYGNTITQELLARRNEGSLGFEIASICLMNGALFPETHRPILAQKLLISPVGALFGRLIPDAVFKKSLANVFGSKTQPSVAELNDFAEQFNCNGGKRIAHRLIRYMSERVKYRERWLRPLQNLDVPFRFINGLSDPVSGGHLVRRFRELVPDQADIVEFPELGHFPHFECPQMALIAILEFHDRLMNNISAKS